MNERTEELVKQAAEYAIEFAVKDQELYIPKLMEKFAELIVRECLEIVEDEDDGSADTKPVRWAMIRIKKHFGVEE